MIVGRIKELIKQKRLFQKQLHHNSINSLGSIESKYFFDGEDVSQHKQHTLANYYKAYDKVGNQLKKIETKMRSNKQMIGQDLRVRIGELKALKAQLNLILQRINKVNQYKLSDLKVEFEDTLGIFQEQYQYLARQF